MAKRNLLLVDADPRSVRVLEVSLRKAGYSVTTSNSVDDALELVELTEPDMVISDTQLEGKDGFLFIEALKAKPQLCKIPFVFLSTDGAVESKVRGLELGADEYLTKPVYIREILTRIHLIFQRQEQEGALRTSKTRFAGSLADMGLVDLLQTIDVSRKSGVLHLTSGSRRGAVYFADGRLVDAELGEITGEAAVYRFLVWSEGEFEVDFREVRREDRIEVTTQGILMEGMRRLDEWGRLQEQLPVMSTVFQVNHDELLQRLAEIPDEINDVFRLFDGKRTLADVVDASMDDDLATLNAISKLYFEGFIVPGENNEEQEYDEDGDGDVLIGGGHPAGEDDVGADTLVEPREAHPGPDQGASAVDPAPADEGFALEDADEGVRLPQHAQPIARVELERVAVRRDRQDRDGGGAGAPSRSSTQGRSGPVRDTERGLAPAPEPGNDEYEPQKSDGASDPREDIAVATPTIEESRSLKPTDARSETESQPHASQDAGDEASSGSNVIRFPSSPARGGEGESAGEGGTAAAIDTSERDSDSREASAGPGADGSAEMPSASASERGQDDGEGPQVVQEEAQGPRGEAQDPQHAPDGRDVTSPGEDDLPIIEPAEDRLLRAGSDASDQDAVETFFSTPVPPAHHEADNFADLTTGADQLAVARRRAQNFGIAITLGVFLMLGGFLFYYRASMNQEAIGPARVSLPTPDLMRDLPSDPEPEVEGPVVEAPPAVEEPAAVPAAVEPASEEASASEEAAEAAAPGEALDEAYAGLLEEARRLGFKRAAEKIYLRALALKPEGDQALSGLGMVLLNRGKNQLALERAAQAVAINPENSEGWIVLGAAHDALGHNVEARKAYRRCAEQGTGKYVIECRRMLR